MHGTLHDLRAAARAMVRSPRFAGVAIVTLAVAIAVNAAMFSFISAIFLRPLPFAAPAELRDVRIEPVSGGLFEAPAFMFAADALAPYGSLAAYTERGFVVSADPAGGAERASIFVPGAGADDRLFFVLGVAPVHGRTFTAADVAPGAAPTVVISDRFWRATLQARPDAVGQMLRVDGVDHTILGIMPVRFAFPDFAQFWVAMASDDARIGDVQTLFRVNDAAAAEAAPLALEGALATRGTEARVRMVDILPNGGPLIVALLGAIGFVLLIACTNVANLVLARATGRRHEIGVRAALGASRGALMRYLSMEGVLLAVAAAILGTIASSWLADLIIAVIPSDGLPVSFEMRLDITVIGYIAGLTIVSVLVSATLPAITVTRGSLATIINQAGTRSVGDSAAGRLRAGLIGAQITLAMVLLAGAALLLRAFGEMNAIDPGYPADTVLDVRVQRPVGMDGDGFIDTTIDRLDALAGVAGAAAVARGPAGRIVPAGSPELAVLPESEAVSRAFFATVGLPLLAGRTFESQAGDRRSAVVSASVANMVFGSVEQAVGSSFRFEGDAAGAAFTVIGVVQDRRRASPGRGVELQRHAYVPLAGSAPADLRLLVRASSGNPLRIAVTVSEILRQADNDMVVRTPRLLGDVERDLSGNVRFFASVFSAFGAVALSLAALGIWGIVAYTVSRRTREIGLRMTLGATGTRVVREIAFDTLPPVAAGLGAGVIGTIVLGRLLQSMLFGIGPADPVAIGSVVLLFGAITMASAWLPARRAARVDPMTALRKD